MFCQNEVKPKNPKCNVTIPESCSPKTLNLVIDVKLKNKTKLLFGCLYRSDGGTEENKTELLNMIGSVSKLKYTHIVLTATGDCNLPDINWDLWITKSENPNNIPFKFIECLRDNFMFQHVKKKTRGRGTNKSNILDLILSNEEDNIDEIKYFNPLGKSDHSVIKFNILCNVAKNNYT